MASPNASPNRGRPRDARVAEAALDAALELVAERGIDRVTIDSIAQRAGVGKASLYRRWASKDELVGDAIARVVDREIRVPDTGTLRGDLQALLTDATQLYATRPAAALMAQIVAGIARNPTLAEDVRGRFLPRRRETLAEIFDRAAARGEAKAPNDVALLLDVLAGPLFYRLLVTGDPLDEALVSGVTDLLVNAVSA